MLEKLVRKLAKSHYYQTLFGQEKYLGFRMFDNEKDLSGMQILFLNYLSFYSALNLDIALNEVTDIVLENEVYEDAYMYYKRKSRNKKPDMKNKKVDEINSTQFVFRRPKKSK